MSKLLACQPTKKKRQECAQWGESHPQAALESYRKLRDQVMEVQTRAREDKSIQEIVKERDKGVEKAESCSPEQEGDLEVGERTGETRGKGDIR